MMHAPTRKLLVFGAGGLGRLVLDVVRQAREWRPVALLDSNPELRGRMIDGLAVRGGLPAAGALRSAGVEAALVAVGDNAARMRLAEALRGMGFHLASAIHPTATVSHTARLGEHLVIGPRATICVHAVVEDHCVIGAGAIVEHDNRLEAGAFLHPAVRLAGGVKVGRQATIGIGACVIPYRSIGAEAWVRPGAVVVRDVPSHGLVGGVPARLEFAPASSFTTTRSTDPTTVVPA